MALVLAPCTVAVRRLLALWWLRSEANKTAGAGARRHEERSCACLVVVFAVGEVSVPPLSIAGRGGKLPMHPHVNRTAAWRRPAFWPRNVVKYRRAAFTGLIYLRATDGERITARRSTQGARTPVVRSNKPVPLEHPRGLIAAARPCQALVRPAAAPPRAAEAARAATATNKDARRPRALRRGLRYY